MTIESITKEDLIKEYGKVEVTFSSYYKYTFYFSGVLPNGDTIDVGAGETASDIYRWEVIADKKQTIEELEPWNCYITEKTGNRIYFNIHEEN